MKTVYDSHIEAKCVAIQIKSRMKKPKTLYRRIHGGRHKGRKREPFYDSARWKKLRKEMLSIHPFCSDPFFVHKTHCENVAATEVDHIIPRRDNLDLELAPWNLQPLCKSCHSRKTAEGK